MNSEGLRDELCTAFCRDLSVRAVPAGLAISGVLEDGSGDPVRCFIEKQQGGWRLVDDGQFLADLDSRGIERRNGPRSEFLTRILSTAGASIGEDELQIVTSITAEIPEGRDVIKFLSALIRAKDITFWNKDRVKSTFKEDVYKAISERLEGRAILQRGSPVDSALKDFPADITIQPTGSGRHVSTAVFLAQSTETLGEALMLWQELKLRNKMGIRVVAVVEDGAVSTSGPKFQRVVNRIDAVTFYRGDEDAAIERVERTALAPA